MPKKETGLEHICELPPEEDFAFVFIPEDTIKARVRRCIVRRITISATDVRTIRFFKSTKAINLERERHLKNHMNIIHPFSSFRRFWNAFMIVSYIYAMLLIPIYVAFICTSHEKPSIWILLDLIQCFLCFIDMIVNFCTGYVQNSETIVLLSWKIFVYYLRTFLVFDLISCIPFDHIICFISGHCPLGQLIASLRLLKFARIFTLHKYIQEVVDSLQIAVMAAEVLWILIAVFFTVHLLCCLQYLLGYLTAEYDSQSWVVEEEQLTSLSYFKRYVAAFFRASTAFLNMGFGLTNPESSFDQVFVIIIAAIGAILLIICIGKFLQWTYISNSSAVLFGEMIQQLNSYMKYKRLPLSLKKRLTQYYQFRYQDNFFNEAQILNALSTHLRQEIVLHSCWRLVENVSFFKNLPNPLLTRIVVCLQAEFFLANDVIVKAGTVGDSMYFIALGTVAIYTPTGKEVCHLEDGGHFGEIALMSRTRRRVASVVAVESCELYRLHGEEFKKAVSPYPDLMARIERIAEERYERTAQLDEKNRRQQESRQKRAQRRK